MQHGAAHSGSTTGRRGGHGICHTGRHDRLCTARAGHVRTRHFAVIPGHPESVTAQLRYDIRPILPWLSGQAGNARRCIARIELRRVASEAAAAHLRGGRHPSSRRIWDSGGNGVLCGLCCFADRTNRSGKSVRGRDLSRGAPNRRQFHWPVHGTGLADIFRPSADRLHHARAYSGAFRALLIGNYVAQSRYRRLVTLSERGPSPVMTIEGTD